LRKLEGGQGIQRRYRDKIWKRGRMGEGGRIKDKRGSEWEKERTKRGYGEMAKGGERKRTGESMVSENGDGEWKKG
jgi:hypothetical protein